MQSIYLGKTKWECQNSVHWSLGDPWDIILYVIIIMCVQAKSKEVKQRTHEVKVIGNDVYLRLSTSSNQEHIAVS